MAGLSMAVPRGAMVINLSKRKRAGKALSHVETVASWNAAHPTHPRAGDGKFSATAGDVMSALQAWHSPRGGDDTGVGDWEAADLQSVKTHATNLARAIEMEQHRRKASEINAKPLTVKKPTKAIPADLQARVEAIRKRPMSSDIDYLNRELPKLTVAQLFQLATQGDNWADTPLPPGSKASKVENTARRLLGPLSSEAVTHQGSARGSEYDNEYRRRLKLASDRGDREEYAALVAGFGIAGTGPGLPPEKGEHPGANWVTNENVSRYKRDREATEAAMGKPLTARAKTSGTISNDKINDLHDLVNKKDLAPEDRDRAKAILNSMTVAQLTSYAEKNDLVLSGKTKEDKVNSLTYQLVGGRLDTQAIQGGKWMDSPAGKAISDIVANPKDGDAERLSGWLNSLKASELGDMAAKHKIKLVGRTKKEKIESFVDSAVQNKLNSEAIRESVGDALDVGGANRAFRGATHTSTKMKQLEDKVARLSVALDVENRKRKAGGSRIQSAREGKLNRELTAAKRERDDAREQTGWAPGVHEDDANEAMDQALVDKIKQAGPTRLNTPSRTSGDGQFWGGHYHGDGVMGSAISRMTAEQKAINVNGDRLDDALADVIIEGHGGEIGVSQRQIQAWMRISNEVRPIDPAASFHIDQAVSRLKPASVPSIDPEAFAAAPEPLKKLWKRLEAIPDTGQGGKEMNALADIMARWEAGDLRAMAMEMDLSRLTGLRHESQEGRFETKRAVEEAMGEIKAMMPALRARQGGRRERDSTRNALEEARANLESQYGEDPDRWPEARQDREVEAYYDLRDKLRRLGG